MSETMTASEPWAMREIARMRDPLDVVGLRAARVRNLAPRLPLEKLEVARRLVEYPAWETHPARPGLVRLYFFPTAKDAVRFALYAVSLLGDLEDMPDVELLGSMLSISIASAPEVGQVTERDFDLVALLEARGEVAG